MCVRGGGGYAFSFYGNVYAMFEVFEIEIDSLFETDRLTESYNI
jgi:hypothetical protein